MSKAYFNEEICKGCGLCVTVCPKNIVALDTGKLNKKCYNPAGVTDSEKCIGCAFCAMICPDCAIEVKE